MTKYFIVHSSEKASTNNPTQLTIWRSKNQVDLNQI